jgi:hypothetical protein
MTLPEIQERWAITRQLANRAMKEIQQLDAVDDAAGAGRPAGAT